jgi:hypothetical protein
MRYVFLATAVLMLAGAIGNCAVRAQARVSRGLRYK